MTAPLQKSSGAPVAQIKCATGEFPLRINPAAQARATAPLLVAQAQQTGFFQQRGNPRQQCDAAMQKNPDRRQSK